MEAMHKLQQENIQKQLMAQQLLLQQQVCPIYGDSCQNTRARLCFNTTGISSYCSALAYYAACLASYLCQCCIVMGWRQRQCAQDIFLHTQGLAGGLTAQKKQREVYVGNLTIGVVTDNHLKELFNGALSHLVPDPHSNPPVVSAQLDPSGNV